MQPMNYSINVPDPSQAFLAGVQERVALDQLQQQRMAAQQQQLAQQQIQQVLNNPRPRTKTAPASSPCCPRRCRPS